MSQQLPARPPLVVIVGPTAAGKSSLAESLGEAIGGQLISADALQLYRGLNIGTAKPARSTRERIPYHCVDVLDPRNRSTAGDYARRARRAIADVWRQGQWPILVGGSGFYVQATIRGIDPLPPSDPDWRRVLESLLGRIGAAELHQVLQRLDPDRAAAIGAQDTQRTLRSLELVLRTGRRFSDLTHGRAGACETELESIGAPLTGDVVWLGITWPRDELNARIEQRVDAMLGEGWLEEVRGLLVAGVRSEAHALQAIGYRELAAVVRGEEDLGAARELIVTATRRYAKRQLSWFRRIEEINWVRLSERGDGMPPEAAVEILLARVRSLPPC